MSTKEISMLDVGKHCNFCRQLDFLPFYCSFCKGTFCKEHRTKELHHCSSLKEELESKRKNGNQTAVHKNIKIGNEEYFKKLLPEPGYIRVQQEQNQKLQINRNSIKSQLLNSNKKSALYKLKKFFEKNSKKHNSRRQKQTTGANKLLIINKMKKTAKGDKKIPENNRIYCWCYAIDDFKVPEKQEFYINKIWPIGRVLDYLAVQLDMKNINNDADVSLKDKLFLYKGDNEESAQLLNTSDRVNNKIFNGDTLYVVRGEETFK